MQTVAVFINTVNVYTDYDEEKLMENELVG